MNPTWNTLTLLLLSTVLLVVTWMAATQRLAGASRSDDPLLAMLVNFVGVLLALSGVLLFTMVTVITDSVSHAWCTCHGIVLLFFTLMSANLLLLLTMSTWSLLLRGVRLETQFYGVRRGAALAAMLSMPSTLIGALVGNFEQRTLFCFMYKPPAAALLLFEIPVLCLSVLSTLFAVWTAMVMFLKRSKASRLLSAKLQATLADRFNTGEGNDRSDEDLDEGDEANEEHKAMHKAAPVGSQKTETSGGELQTLYVPEYERSPHMAMHQIKFQTKLVTLLLVISVSCMIGIIIEIMDSANWLGNQDSDASYYQGQTRSAESTQSVASTKSSGLGSASEGYRESQTGWAVIYLSLCGILVFSLLSTGPGLWELRRSYW